MKIEVEDHNITSNVYHTQLLLKKYLLCDKELHETKSKLIENENELNNTKSKLEAKTKELEMAKKDIVKLETCFEKQYNEIIPLIHKSTEIFSQQLNKAQPTSSETIFKSTLNTLEEPTQLTIQPPIQTKEKTYQFVEFNKLILQKYVENLNVSFNSINNGQLFHINDNECFFKLRLQRNYRWFFIHHVGDLASHRSKSTVLSNEDLVLNTSSTRRLDSTRYSLFVAIENYDEKNNLCFLVNTKECGKNLLLEYGCNKDIRWELFKNENYDEVIFYFKK